MKPVPVGRPNPGRSRRWWLLAAFALAATGCVDFEKETMVFVFPPDSPEVRGLLVYEGLGVVGALGPGNPKEGDLQSAKEQLTHFIRSGQDFCLGHHFALFFSLAAADADPPATRARRAALRDLLTIHNGALFKRPDGRLCGYQTITVRDRKKLVTELNALMSSQMARMAEAALASQKNPPSPWDEESLRRLQKAGQTDFTWFQLDPGRASLTMPATPAAVRRLKRDFFWAEPIAEVRKWAAPADLSTGPGSALTLNLINIRQTAERMEQGVRFLSDTPWSFDQRHDRFTVALGLGHGEPIRLATENWGGPYKYAEELLAHARSLGAPFREQLTAERLITDFLKGQGTLPRP
jgi:hypothetical protein